MGSLSDYAENALLNHIFNTAYTRPITVYLALCTADPTDAATGAACNEAANANNYTRKAISFGAASVRRITQDANVDFNTALGAWGTITHWVITDSATYGAGNVLAHGQFSASFAPVNGNTPRVASAQIYVEFNASSTGGIPTAIANNLLGHMFDNTLWTSPASNTFLALLNATCSDAATTMAGQTEVSGTSYARKEVNESGGASPAWTSASGGAISNAHDATFTNPGGTWTQMVAVAVVDALSGTSANVLWYDNGITDQVAVSGDIVQFLAGDFDIAMT